MSGTSSTPASSRIVSASAVTGPFATSKIDAGPDVAGVVGVDRTLEGGGRAQRPRR
jgi:hypothetical protein